VPTNTPRHVVGCTRWAKKIQQAGNGKCFISARAGQICRGVISPGRKGGGKGRIAITRAKYIHIYVRTYVGARDVLLSGTREAADNRRPLLSNLFSARERAA